MKSGIFGGTFDPFHNGHLNSLRTVKEQLGLDEIRVVPAFQSPFRQPLHGPEPEQRLQIVEAALEPYADELVVDDREIRRKGVSWTIETLRSLVDEDPDREWHLIIGMDQFENFDRWKDFDKILELAHLVVTSRPESELPTDMESFPPGVRAQAEDFDGATALLKGGKNIYFIQLEDVEASGTEIRRRLRAGQSISELVPLEVENKIRSLRLYESFDHKIGDFEAFTHFCAKVLEDKGGISVLGYDLREIDAPSEFTLITSGTSTRHAQALAESVSRAVKQEYGVFPQSVEGTREGRWVVLDYGSLMVHIFYDYVRQEYRLEELWRDAKLMKLEPAAAVARK